MGLLGNITKIFGQKAVNLEARFKKRKTWCHTLTGPINVVSDIKADEKFTLKTVIAEKTNKIRERYGRLKFPSEGEIAESLSHPGILGTLETGRLQNDGQYILADFVDGPFLEEAIAYQPKMLRGKQLKLIRKLVEAISEIHNQGYIHRDLSTANIVLDPNFENLKIFNFSLMIPNEAEFKRISTRAGTPLFMAPEVVRRKGFDERVDIFAFGIIAYQIIALRHPWGVTENVSRSSLIFDTTTPANIQELVPKLDSKIAEAIMGCLHPDPEKRIPSMKKFAIAIGIR